MEKRKAGRPKGSTNKKQNKTYTKKEVNNKIALERENSEHRVEQAKREAVNTAKAEIVGGTILTAVGAGVTFGAFNLGIIVDSAMKNPYCSGFEAFGIGLALIGAMILGIGGMALTAYGLFNLVRDC